MNKLNILFMCVANSARSQMAEGLAKSVFADHEGVQIASAGSEPTTVNKFAIKAMRDAGIDISEQSSKSVDQLPADFVDSLNFVITLCAEEVCPTVITGAEKLHWPLPDPAGKDSLSEAEQFGLFCQTRDQIKAKLDRFRRELPSSSPK